MIASGFVKISSRAKLLRIQLDSLVLASSLDEQRAFARGTNGRRCRVPRQHQAASAPFGSQAQCDGCHRRRGRTRWGILRSGLAEPRIESTIAEDSGQDEDRNQPETTARWELKTNQRAYTFQPERLRLNGSVRRFLLANLGFRNPPQWLRASGPPFRRRRFGRLRDRQTLVS